MNSDKSLKILIDLIVVHIQFSYTYLLHSKHDVIRFRLTIPGVVIVLDSY